MKTYTTLTNLATTLSQNTTSLNQKLMGELIGDQHRYLIQRYFDNEKTVTNTTVGSMNLTLTAPLSIGTVSGTLTASWTYPTNSQLVNFSDGEQRNVLFTNGSTAITWSGGLTGPATTAIRSVGVQYYRLPANISKIKNLTVNVGQLKYQPTPIESRQDWDMVNFLPYTSDIPNYFFLYDGKLGIFPVPSTTGNIITFNYKTRVADLSFADYSTGNITTAAAGSTSVTGTATSWSTVGTFPLNTDLGFYNLALKINPPYGDGIWYPISQFTSDTTLTLASPLVHAPNITAATTYTIGQLPLLFEDFHDMLVYGALTVYFSTIVPDANKFKEFDALYKDREEMISEYLGTKQINVDLGDSPQAVNPNLFIYANN